MIRLSINGIAVEAPASFTILRAAHQTGIAIPTLCYADGQPPHTSCMVCVVEEVNKQKLLPACAAPVEPGMMIETESERVRKARQAALELILSEHAGDCEAPCERACPAGLTIPLMLRLIQQDKEAEVRDLVQDILVLPATLGYICTAPCEAGCRRGAYDEPVAIRFLHRQIGEQFLRRETIHLPTPQTSPQKVLVIGSGPAGLAAAYTVALHGHECTVIEKRNRAGGRLREIAEEKLPSTILDAEINVLRNMGINFLYSKEATQNMLHAASSENYVVIIVACNNLVLKHECVFYTKEFQMPVRSIASGKEAATRALHYIAGQSFAPGKNFRCTMGRFTKDQVRVYAEGRISTEAMSYSRTPHSPLVEATRCLHCDCHSPVSCKLRQYATRYGATQNPFPHADLVKPNGIKRYGDVIYDSGKCIKCGICVSITEKYKDTLGMTFMGRGFTMEVGIPFGESLEYALSHHADECITHCPTGALASERIEERMPPKE